MAVRFYVDADTLGLAHSLVRLRGDVTYPGDPGGTFKGIHRPPCPVGTTDVADTVWIPIVAAAGWLVLTRDRSIARRPHELASVMASGARPVTISSKEKLDNWHLLEVVMTQWRRIEGVAQLPGPFIYGATRTSFTEIA